LYLKLCRQSISITRRPAHCAIHRRSSVYGTVWQSKLLVSIGSYSSSRTV